MIYRTKVRGKTLESRDLRKLLARAVAEKRTMDRRLGYFLQSAVPGWNAVDGSDCTPEFPHN